MTPNDTGSTNVAWTSTGNTSEGHHRRCAGHLDDDHAVYDPVMTLGEDFKLWKSRRAARKAAAQDACEACRGPLGDNPWTTYYRTCSADCEEAAASCFTM